MKGVSNLLIWCIEISIFNFETPPYISTNFWLSTKVCLPSTVEVALVATWDSIEKVGSKLCKFLGSDIS
jgi:hypothetical protein